MRIERLDLTAFGSFTGTALDFSQAGTTFHVVLGPNAAGKSTALRAMIDLLFGIPERTSDDFLHTAQTLRIGAEIVAADGRRLSCVRRKGRKNTLLDAAGKALPEAALQAVLGVLDRDQFVAMFGLDHDRLRRGADDLLRAGGALGESLFEAAGGTRSIRSVLESLQAAADDLFRPRASTPAVNRHIAAYEEARKQARDAALAGEKFRQVEEEVEALARTSEAERGTLADLEADLARMERIQRNLPRAARRAQLLAQIAALDRVPDLPLEARDQRLELTANQRQLTDALRSDEADIVRIEQELAGLDVPETLLAEGPAIRDLTQRLGAEHKASADRPKLQARVTALHQERGRLLSAARAGLDVERAQLVRPARPQAARLRELARGHSELRTALRAADKNLAKARSAVEEAVRRLAQAVGPPDARPLAEALRAVRAEGTVQKQHAESLAKRAALLERAGREAAALPHWQGPLETLVALAVPLVSTVQQFVTRFGAMEQGVGRARDRVDAQAEVLASKEAELAVLQAAGELPTLGDLDAARGRRDDGWTLIRRAFIDARQDVTAAAAAYDATRALPEAYEASVTAADALADRLRADADRVARHESLHRERTETAGRLADEQARLARAEDARRATDDEWHDLWRPLNIAPRSPAEMLQWLDAHRRIRESVEAARDEQQRGHAFGEAMVRCRSLLLDALRRVGRAAPDDATDLAVLTSSAESLLGDLTEAVRQRAMLEASLVECRDQQRLAEDTRTTAVRDLEGWQREWAAAVVPLGYTSAASPTEVEEFLRLLDEALGQHDAAREVERRLEGIDRDSGAFARDVGALATRVAPDLAERPAADTLAAITERHERATRDQATRTEKQGQLATLRARVDQTRRALANVEAGIGRLLARASCTTVDELEHVEAAAARKAERGQQLADLEALFVAEGAGLTLEQLLAEVADQHGDRIAAATADLRNRKEMLAAERDGHLREHGQRQRELEGMRADTSGAALAAQVAEEELAAVRDRAEEYVRLRLAEIVLREFVERYRVQHQDPILQRASVLFPVLTRDTFSAVRTDFDDKDQAVLIGIDAAGAALRVEAMSDGTRDQLFLALRLAAVEQYLATGEPLPFIADDLLVHFDDARARATLRVLAEFSRRTQVLFFTHHRHLVDLAQEVVPAALLGIQTLGGREGA